MCGSLSWRVSSTTVTTTQPSNSRWTATTPPICPSMWLCPHSRSGLSTASPTSPEHSLVRRYRSPQMTRSSSSSSGWRPSAPATMTGRRSTWVTPCWGWRVCPGRVWAPPSRTSGRFSWTTSATPTGSWAGVRSQLPPAGPRAYSPEPKLPRHHAPLPEPAHLSSLPVLKQEMQHHFGGWLNVQTMWETRSSRLLFDQIAINISSEYSIHLRGIDCFQFDKMSKLEFLSNITFFDFLLWNKRNFQRRLADKSCYLFIWL